MARGIFLIHPDNALTELRETPYDSESLLQQLLGDHPSILAGEEENNGAPRRWLLITREAAVPGAADGGGRWSVDHVFLDQNAVPTLVEVKRSTDTRIRREIVGQMLDYAANAMAYWPPEQLRITYEARCATRGVQPADDLRAALGEALDQEEFWERAKINLSAGRLRLVFVSDQIPAELRRIIEFLNGQMDPAEVLAIEVRQYTGDGLRTLVPTVLGQTAEAQQRKGTARVQASPWDELRFMTVLGDRCGEEVVTVARRILRGVERRATRIYWGKGPQMGSFGPLLSHGGVDHQMFMVYTYGKLEILFEYFRGKRPFDDETLRRELLNRLNTIPGVRLPEDAVSRRPSLPLASLSPPGALQYFLTTYAWYCEQIIGLPLTESR